LDWDLIMSIIVSSPKYLYVIKANGYPNRLMSIGMASRTWANQEILLYKCPGAIGVRLW